MSTPTKREKQASVRYKKSPQVSLTVKESHASWKVKDASTAAATLTLAKMAGSTGGKIKTVGSKVSAIKTVPIKDSLTKVATVPKPIVKEENSVADEVTLAGKLVAEVEAGNPDVKTLCESYGLKREELGRMTGFSLRALAEWSSGKLPSQPAKRRLQEVRRLLDALSGLVKPEVIPKWLHNPNNAFEGMTPLQVIELGEIDRLWAMIHELGSDQPA